MRPTNGVDRETSYPVRVDSLDGPAIIMHVYNAVSGIVTDIEFSLPANRRLLKMKLRFCNTLPVENGFMYWANAAVSQTPKN